MAQKGPKRPKMAIKYICYSRTRNNSKTKTRRGSLVEYLKIVCAKFEINRLSTFKVTVSINCENTSIEKNAILTWKPVRRWRDLREGGIGFFIVFSRIFFRDIVKNTLFCKWSSWNATFEQSSAKFVSKNIDRGVALSSRKMVRDA